jgi:diaminopimelate decarboxylase
VQPSPPNRTLFGFHQQDGKLFLRDRSLESIASEHRTPFYLYDLQGLDSLLLKIGQVLRDYPFLQVCFAVKANGAQPICQRMNARGLGFDVVSGGEFKLLGSYGVDPSLVYFSGVGKTQDEIDLALREQPMALNVESLEELDLIVHRCAAHQKSLNIGFRWNPDLAANTTHRHLQTGSKDDKFGMTETEIFQGLEKIRTSPWVQLMGIHVHAGSQITDLDFFDGYFDKLLQLAASVAKKMGNPLKFLDVGGGLGIFYDSQNISRSPELVIQYLTKLGKRFESTGYRVVCELGRALVGIYGVLVGRVLYKKLRTHKNFLIFDGSMTELLRPMLYRAKHPIWIQYQSRIPDGKTYELTTPICESGDVFDPELLCPYEPTRGDLVGVLGAGAYGRSMASTYNQRPLPEEVFI